MSESPEARPTLSQQRINELDIYRGFAIFGIFMVNILVMNVSFAYRGEWEAEQFGWLQQASFFVLETFFYSKFFAIFSLLFGMGVALQIDRALEKGQYKTSFFIRRFGSLFLFGVAHVLFIWSGDILHLYGMCGFLLLLFFKLPTRALLWSAILVFLFPFYSKLFEVFVTWLEFDYSTPLSTLSREEIFELKHHGSYWSGIKLRLKEYAFAMGLIYSGIAPVALSMMLLGGYLVKKGFLHNISSWVDRVKVPLFIVLAVLLVFRFTLIYWVIPSFDIPFGSALSITLYTFYQLSDILLSLSFLWTLTYLLRSPLLRRLIAPLRHVGRTAFSNYIMQSVLGYLIMRTFNGYESFSAAQCILIVIMVFVAQVLLSKLWLSYFQFGPLEWCWRCISYMKILPIKKTTIDS